MWASDELFRGTGAPAVKSAELSPVSAQPSLFLKADLVALGAGAGDVSKQLAVVP